MRVTGAYTAILGNFSADIGPYRTMRCYAEAAIKGANSVANSKLRLGAVLYPGFEMLDMFGPLEMFSLLGPDVVEICMLAESREPVPSAMGMDLTSGPKVTVDVTFSEISHLDILLVPGGFGTFPQLENDALKTFLREHGAATSYVCSVCTGSLLLARAGLLDGLKATTNKQFFGLSELESADVDWQPEARWVEDGKYFTSSGVSAGMDMALALIAKLLGDEAAEAAANSAEYSWHRDANTDPFSKHLNEGMTALGAG